MIERHANPVVLRVDLLSQSAPSENPESFAADLGSIRLRLEGARPTLEKKMARQYQPTLTLAFVTLIAQPSSSQAEISCLTQGFVPLEVAYEILNLETVSTNPQAPIPTYKGGGTNPMTEAVWNAGYVPPSPYTRNTTRNLQFNESQYISSPSQVVCETSYLTTSDGYTWGAMSTAINAMWPYDPSQYTGQSAIDAYYAGNFVTTPPAGVVKITDNMKAQNMKFWANQNGVKSGTKGATHLNRYFVRDQWGNEYIMHASGKSTDAEVQIAFESAVLPAGWTKSIRQLKTDLTIYPGAGSDGTFQYCVIKDSADNTYHQIGWSKTGNLQAQVAGMPIWGGQKNDVLTGDTNGATDDLIHGAGGNDHLKPGLGNDTVWGDKGVDTVTLPGRWDEYTVTQLSSDLTNLVLSSPYGTKTIRFCEHLRFEDRQISIRRIAKSL